MNHKNRKEIVMKLLVEYLYFLVRGVASFLFGIGFGVIIGSLIVPFLG